MLCSFSCVGLQGRAILRANLLERQAEAATAVSTWHELQKAVQAADPGAVITISSQPALVVNSTIDIRKRITVTGAMVFGVTDDAVSPNAGTASAMIDCSGWPTAFNIR
jgi:hypothetical protein